jgi:hypothetical protein
MWKPYDRVAFATTTTGDGTVAVGPALSGRFFTPVEAGVENETSEIPYLIIDGGDVEGGFGTYDAGTFARDTVHFSKIGGTAGTARIDLSGAATVRFIASAAAFDEILDALAGAIQSGGDAGTPSALVLTNATGLPLSTGVTGTLGAANCGTGNGFTAFSGPASSTKTFTLPNSSQALACLDLEGQTLTGGAEVTSKSLGTASSGTVTPDPSARQAQHYTNGGAHTLAPHGYKKGTVVVDIVNNGSAGAVTTSGFTKKTGDNFTTTNGHKFRCFISLGNEGSLLHVEALQ